MKGTHRPPLGSRRRGRGTFAPRIASSAPAHQASRIDSGGVHFGEKALQGIRVRLCIAHLSEQLLLLIVFLESLELLQLFEFPERHPN